ncbi:hypothetical protein ACIPL1_22000 [Pseudomonas sp. NPDC090202]|uniref:hypothetical protein n=1 Tax=unclassified Pseudomonas TaxID=196821 RepID=UPI0037F1713C
MNIHAAEKVVLIRTRDPFFSTCGPLMQDSVERLKASAGCVYCRLDAEERRLGYWVIRCAWSSLDAMQAGVEGVFQPVFERLIGSHALLSLRICEASPDSD